MPSPTQADDPAEVAQRILVLRGQRVLLDVDLAKLYGVTSKRLNEQVCRNRRRFPEDFIFYLEFKELQMNRSQFATGSQKHRDLRFPPLAFTEHGAIMAATILNSPRAVEMSVYVVRAFEEVYAAIRALMSPPARKSRPIGFTADIESKK